MKKFLKIFLFLLLPMISSCAPVKKQQTSVAKKASFRRSGTAPIIIIDAGHGGLDRGAKGRRPYLEEKKVALTTALLTKKYLDHMGYRVILTRSSDVFIPLYRRVKISHFSRSSLFVSLHYNFAANPQAHGIEVFYCDCKRDKKRSKTSRKLASNILHSMIQRTKARSRGVKKGNFYVIRETKMPAVLVEGGFLSNPSELKKLKQRHYLDRLAKSIAEGIDRYYRS